jgi:hypothetical protein
VPGDVQTPTTTPTATPTTTPTPTPTPAPTLSPIVYKMESRMPFGPPGSNQELYCIVIKRADDSTTGSGCELVEE